MEDPRPQTQTPGDLEAHQASETSSPPEAREAPEALEAARFVAERNPDGSIDVVVLAKPSSPGAKPLRATLARCRNAKVASLLIDALRQDAARTVVVATEIPS